jgi:hypothetical protein
MNWTPDRLNRFKDHFGVLDKEIARAINERPATVWKLRHGELSLDRFHTRLTGYLNAQKAAKAAEMQAMTEFYLSFED